LKAALLVFLGYELMAGLFLYNVSVGSDSMAPSIDRGERVLVSPLAYGPGSAFFDGRLPGLGLPARGDVVLVEPAYFHRAGTFRQVSLLDGRLPYDRGPGLKRVIAVPGDAVYMRDYQYFIRAAGAAHFLSEGEVSGKLYEAPAPALPEGWDGDMPLGGTMGSADEPLVIASGHYFVSSDTRAARNDSADFGPVPLDRIVAKVVLRYWPLSRLGSP
jgi:signal peptidase I